MRVFWSLSSLRKHRTRSLLRALGPGRISGSVGSGGSDATAGSFSQAEYAGRKKQTRRDRFLAEMEQVALGAAGRSAAALLPKGDRGRPPVGLERMLRIYFLQQWYGLAPGRRRGRLG